MRDQIEHTPHQAIHVHSNNALLPSSMIHLIDVRLGSGKTILWTVEHEKFFLKEYDFTSL
jgi:hypothetical protein